MKKLIILLTLVVLRQEIEAQCSFTTSIASSGPSLTCGNVTLTAGATGDIWTQKTNFGGVIRQYAVGFGIGTKGYIGTGNGSSSTYLGDFWEYDPSNNTWTQKANFGGTARYGAVGFSIGTKGYVGTGYSGSYLNDFWEYDPTTNFWTQKASLGGTTRYFASGFSLNGKGYIGTGYNGSYLNDFWEYDPGTNFWTQKANYGGGARYLGVGTAINSASVGYIGTGYSSANGYTNDFWEYSQTNNTWTQKASVGSTPIYGASAFSAGNKAYVVGGYESVNGVVSDKIFEFNQAGNTWTQKTNMGSANGRYYAASFAIGLKGYIGTGYTTVRLNTFWEYETTGNYLWSNGNTSQAITANVSGNYSVLITNGSGCTATAVQSLSLSPNPTITVSGAALSCAGVSNTLLASGAGSFTWSANAGSVNTNSVILTPTVSTTYTVSGTTGTCTVDYPITLNVNPVPVSTIAVNGPTLGCGTVTLSVSSPGNLWTQKAGMNVGRERTASFTIGNKAYVGTGYNSVTAYNIDFWEYDANTNAWTQKANFGGTGRYGGVGLSIGSKGYIGLGYDGAYKSDFWEYDPSTNVWTQKSNFGGGVRYFATAFSIGNKGYVGTGNSGTTHYNDLWEYDPSTNVWTVKSSFGGLSRAGAVSFVINGKGYLGTGSNASTNYSDFWEYDPQINTWSQKAFFGGGTRTSAAGFALGNKGYIGTGVSGGVNSNDLWEYDVIANTWTQKANFGGTARLFAIGFALNGKGFIGLGEITSSPYYVNDIWQYDPTNVVNWSTGSTLQAISVNSSSNYSVSITNQYGCASSSSQSIALSPNPTITITTPTLICQGSTYTIAASGAGTFTWSANAGGGNSNNAVLTPTASGTYTVSGTTGTCAVNYPFSLNVSPSPIATIAVSGPTLSCGSLTLSTATVGDTWTQKAGMNFGRTQAVSFVIGSKGYIGTGNSSSTTYMNDFWEYDPINNSWAQRANFAGGGRFGAAGFSIGSKGYIGTGYDGAYKTDFWEYDPSVNTWTQKAAFNGTSRYNASGWSIGSKGYISLGYSSTYYSDLREYDPVTNTWTAKTSFPGTARYGAVAFVVGTKAFVGTGYSGGYLNDFWEYDQSTNIWLQRANFGGTARYFAAGFAIGNLGFVTTGYDLNAALKNDLWEFNPTANTWTQRNVITPMARYAAQAFAIQGNGYLTNGYASSPTFPNDLWQYTPVNYINWSTSSTLASIAVFNSGTYSLNISNIYGCSAGAAQSVSLSPNPTITVAIPTLVCANYNNTLTASGAGTYTWSANAGNVVSNSVVVTPSAYTTYTVSGTTGTCTVQYPVAVNVSPTPSSFISVSGPTLGCGITTLSSGAPGNVWTQKAGLNAGRAEAVAFAIGSKGYIGTGWDGNYYMNDFWEYDPLTNSWTQKANFAGGARYGAVGFSINNKGYIGTGYDNNYKNDFWEYDPVLNTWTQKANFGGNGRYFAVGFNVQSKGYIGTGYNPNLSPYYYNDFWEYDPATNTWTQRSNFGGATRYGASGFGIGNKGYIGLGANTPYYTDFWEFDPAGNSWVQKASFPGTPRYNATGVSLFNKGYVGAGQSSQSLNDFWEYDPVFNAWQSRSNIGGNNSRYYASAFATNGKVYFGTGYSNSSPYYLNDIWEYSPMLSTTWSTGSTIQAINAGLSGVYSVTVSNQAGCASSSAQTLSLSPNPTITISGAGLVCSGQSNTILASGAGTFTWSANAGGGNSNTVILSPSVSTTYSVSGTTGSCSVTQAIFLDVNQSPITAIAASGPTLGCGSLTLSSTTNTGNVWSQKSSLITARQYPVAFSIAGKGYVGMGMMQNSPYYLNDLWEFDPNNNTWTQKASFIGVARRGSFVFTIGNYAYVGGGEDGTSYRNDFYEYNQSNNSWSQKSSYPTTNIGYAAAFAIGNKGYVGTGYISGTGYTNNFYEYDPSINNWTQKASFTGIARNGAVGLSVGNKGYIFTGYGPSSPYVYNDTWEYDPSLNTWTQKANLGASIGRQFATGFTIGNYAYVGLGIDNSANVFNDLWQYNPATNTWLQKTNLPALGRNAAAGLAISGKGYFGVGYSTSSPNYLNDFWEYTPNITLAWSTGSTLQAIPVSATGNYSLTATSILGCVSSVSQSIALSPNPTVSVSGNTTTACAGNSSTLLATGAGSYTWSANAGGGNSNSVTISPSVTTVYTLTAATGSCGIDIPVQIDVYPSPIANILSSGSGTVCGSSITLSTNVPAGNSWTQKAGLNTGRQSAVAFAIGSKGYIATGYNGSFSPYYYNDLWEYDPNTNAWTQKANFGGTARYYAVGFSIGSKGYVGTGYDLNSAYKNDFWEYDPTLNNWTQKANFGGTARYLASGFAIGTKGYIGTGYDNSYKNDFWEYNPSSNTWTQKANFGGTARYLAVGFGINNKGYIGTGYDGASKLDFWQYDPTLNSWTQKANLGTSGRYAAAVFVLSDRAYVAGGNSLADFWEYNATSNVWTQKTNYGGGYRSYLVGFSVDGKGYMATGNGSSSYLNDLWQYTTQTNYLWSTGSTLQAITTSVSATYSLTLSNIFGCSNTATQVVNIATTPTVSISGPSVVCSGSMLTLTVNGATNYTWSANAGSSNNNTVTLNPAFASTYSVIGASNGCTTTASKVVFVNALPIVTANASSLNVCSGNTLSLYGGGAVTYTWSNGVLNNSVFTPTLTNTYSVAGTDFNACTNTAVVTVTVNSIPVIAVNSGSICQGQNFTLSASGANTYTYSGGSAVVSPTITGTYSVTGTSLSGCVGVSAAIATVNVLSSPTLSVPNGTICSGQSFTFNPSGAVTYSYSGGSSIVSPITNSVYLITGTGANGCSSAVSSTVAVVSSPNVSAPSGSICNGSSFTINPTGASSYTYSSGSSVVSPSATTSYSVYGSNAAGCVNATAAIVTVSVNAIPLISVNSGTICQGQSFTMVPSGAASYTYSSGSAIVSPTISNTYSVSGTSAAGCVAASPAVSSINVLISPTLAVAGGSICNGQSFTINPSGASTYTYSSGSAVVSPSSNTSYTVTGTAANGCNNFIPAIATVTVVGLPSISAPSGSICNGASFTINPTGAGNYTYSSGSSIVSPSITTTYSVYGSNISGCANATAAVVTVTVNAIPVITVNSGTICQGQSFTMVPSGASTYTYSSGTAIVSPTISNSYSVTGTSNAGCVAASPAVSSINVLTSPTLAVVGGSICNGQSFTLNPSGASTYTYSSGSAVVSPSSNTSYTVTGTAANGCNNFIPAIATVTVVGLPSISAPSGSICNGASFTINPTGAGNYTYSSGSSIVSPSITTTYSVFGSNTSGCANATAAVVTVTVNAIPVITVNSGTICQGQSFTMVPSGASTYTYSSGTAIVSPTISNSYSVTGTSNAGCVAASPAVSSINVLISPTLAVAGGSICNGQSFTFNPSGASTYTYSSGSAVVSPSSNTSYTVTGTAANGCNNFIPAVAVVTVVGLPNITAPSGSICVGSSFTVNPSGAISYTYSSGSSVVSPTANSTYSVYGSNAAGCVNTLAALVTVTVNAIPVISVNSGTICQGQNFTINPSGASTYTYSGGTAVVSPTSTNTYSVIGTSSAGCVAASSVISTVNVLNSPTLSVSGGTICSGQSFTLSASGANTYTYSSGSPVVSPTANTAYTVTGTAANGCVNYIPAVSTVTVRALPLISVSSGSICEGNSFTISPTAGGGGAVSYTYSGGNAVVNPSTTTTYSVSGTSSLGCVSASPAVLTVTVNSIPVITVNGGTICQGQSFTLTPNGASSYTISGGTATVSPLANTAYTISGTSSAGCVSTLSAVSNITVAPAPIISVSGGTTCVGGNFTMIPSGAVSYTYSSGSAVVNPTISTTYSISGTNSLGCVSLSQTPVSITVSPLPIIVIPNASLCIGDSYTFNPSGALTYTYSSGSNVVSPTITTSYSVTGTSSNGCVSSTAAVVQVSVFSLPSITVPSTAVICNGNAYTITPNGAVSYTFSGGSAVVTPTGNTTYTVSGSSSQGCVGSAVISVSVQPSLSLSIAGASLVCEGQSVTLQSSGANTYTWNNGNTNATVVVTPSALTVYSVSGGSGNCTGSASFTVNVNSNPTLVAVSSSSLICADESITISVSGANSYTWDSGANTTSISVNPSVTTTYSVIGEDSNGCVDTTSIIQMVDACTKIAKNDIASVLDINVYPNPGSGMVHVQLNSQLNHTKVEIFNYLGQMVLREEAVTGLNTYRFTQLANGMYTLRVVSGDEVKYLVKLIKE